MTGYPVHELANELLDCWETNDRQGWADTHRRHHTNHGPALANTAKATANWQIRQYNKRGIVFDWRDEHRQQRHPEGS